MCWVGLNKLGCLFGYEKGSVGEVELYCACSWVDCFGFVGCWDSEGDI